MHSFFFFKDAAQWNICKFDMFCNNCFETTLFSFCSWKSDTSVSQILFKIHFPLKPFSIQGSDVGFWVSLFLVFWWICYRTRNLFLFFLLCMKKIYIIFFQLHIMFVIYSTSAAKMNVENSFSSWLLLYEFLNCNPRAIG